MSVNSIPKEEFYLTRGLSHSQTELMAEFSHVDDQSKEALRGIIPLFAQERGLSSKNIQLRLPQIDPVVLSYINPRFFIGDKPGLGKTVMSAASFAYYGYMQLQEGQPIGKILVVTEAAHVVKFAKEWQSYGINVMPLSGGTVKTERSLAEFDFNEHDGVVIGWDGLKTNGFLDFYLRHHKEFKMGIFDETSKLLNPKSMLYEVSDAIINTYQNGLDRVLFLNGSTFEKNIYDFYYQFNILQPKLIPSKKFLDDRYVVKEMSNVYRRGATGKVVNQRFADIVDYKNQDELRERLKYFYIARSKEDFASDLPVHEYNLHVITMTEEQEQALEEIKHISVVNSPRTSDETKTLTRDNAPKLDDILTYFVQHAKDRPIIYAYNTESQRTLCAELKKLGYKVEVLNGESSAEDKAKIVDKFNNYKIDTLVFNVQKAINLPTSDRILFYDIPTMPQQTSQIKARIDRNNYTTAKKYDFFCYYLSPEWLNLSRLGHFREHHSNEFTGQKDYVYSQLTEQMSEYIEQDVQTELKQTYETMYQDNKKFNEVESKIKSLLNIVG